MFDIKDHPEYMYILKKGKLAQETELEIENKNRFPIATDKWEEQIKTRKVWYELRQIGEKETFGHQEIIELFRQAGKANN